MLGRFGHKAMNSTLAQQNADAFWGDIGISNPLFQEPWGACTENQPDCRAAPHGDGDDRVFEIDAEGMELVNFYVRDLAVPARRDVDEPQVLRGKQVFHEAKCAARHQPAFVTHRLEDRPQQSCQLIWPYTNLLLHDMGDGLADNRPEAGERARMAHAAALGKGMTETVSGHTYFLHDGRARNLLEALLWHGGEAQGSRDAVVALPPADRAALISFLESL